MSWGINGFLGENWAALNMSVIKIFLTYCLEDYLQMNLLFVHSCLVEMGSYHLPQMLGDTTNIGS